MQKHQLIEPLESRIAPATVLNPTTVVYSDVDGDDVTIHISKPLFTAENLDQVLLFSNSAARFDGSIPQALSSFLVTNFGDAASGLDISITAKRNPILGGNGVVDVGGIDAFNQGGADNVDLGKVRVQGDLKFIDAGDADFTTPALKSLNVLSIGEAISDVKSEINGSIGTWKVRGNMFGQLVQTGSKDLVHVGKIFIGGSLGRSDSDVQGGGALFLAGSTGSITIVHDLIGGSAVETGFINIAGSLGTLTIGGSVRAGESPFTGLINVQGDAGSIRIGGDLAGGPSQVSGILALSGAGTTVGSIQIGGSIIGGNAPHSGAISAGHARSITVGHDLIGQTDDASGIIFGDIIDKVRIGGSMIGADTTAIPDQTFGTGSGSIFVASSIGSVSVGGDVIRANIVAGISSGQDFEFGPGSETADSDLNLQIVSRIAQITIKGSVNTGASGHYGIEANSIGNVRIGGVTYLHSDPSINFAQGFTVDAAERFTIREL